MSIKEREIPKIEKYRKHLGLGAVAGGLLFGGIPGVIALGLGIFIVAYPNKEKG